MDDLVKKLLDQWNLEKFIERFEEAGIIKETITRKGDDVVNKLASKMFDERKECGFFERFIDRLTEWRANYQDDSNESPNNSFSRIPIHSLPQNSHASENHSIISNNMNNSIILQASNLPTSQSNSIDQQDLQLSLVLPIVRRTVAELMTGAQGTLIMHKYKKLKFIDTRKLSSLVVWHELDFSPQFRISTERFLKLAKETSEIFEKPDTVEAKKLAKRFYYPYTKATNNTKAVKAGGVYYDKYSNIRRKKIEFGEITDLIDDDYADDAKNLNIQWLFENDNSQEETIDKWILTINDRNPPCKKIKDYLLTYKGLQSTFGHILLAIDYDFVHPGFVPLESSNWTDIASKIILRAKNKKKLTPSLELLAENDKKVAALFTLSYLLGPICCKQKNVEHFFGNTVIEVQQSFIFHTQSRDSLEELKSIRAKASKALKNHKIGPYIVFIGDLKDEGKLDAEVEVLIIVENYEYKVVSNSLSDAVDYCYKIVKRLKIDFPTECKHIWMFLEEFVYQRPIEGKSYAVVNTLIAALKEIDKENSDENINCLEEQL